MRIVDADVILTDPGRWLVECPPTEIKSAIHAKKRPGLCEVCGEPVEGAVSHYCHDCRPTAIAAKRRRKRESIKAYFCAWSGFEVGNWRLKPRHLKHGPGGLKASACPY